MANITSAQKQRLISHIKKLPAKYPDELKITEQINSSLQNNLIIKGGKHQ